MSAKKANLKNSEDTASPLDDLDLLSQSIENQLADLKISPQERLPKPTPLKRKRPLKKTAYHHGDLRQSLIDAALQLMIQDGSKSLSLRNLAKAVGVSPAAPYRHFEDKQALIAAVATQGFEILASQMAELPPSKPLESIKNIATRYLQFALNYPDYFRIMSGSEIQAKTPYPELQAARNKTMFFLLESIQNAKTAGLFKVIPSEQIALTLWCQWHGFACLLVEDQLDWKTLDVESPEELLSQSLTWMFQGLCSVTDIHP